MKNSHYRLTQVIIVVLVASILLFNPTLAVYSSTNEDSEEEPELETGEGETTEVEQSEGQENEEQERQTLPYCDTPEGEAAQSCHDRDDYDEDTGLYPCNDGTQKSNPDDCPDASKGTQSQDDSTNNEICDPSYPEVCIAPPPPDLNCDDVPYNNIQVVGSDPHGFDGEGDGIGCES